MIGIIFVVTSVTTTVRALIGHDYTFPDLFYLEPAIPRGLPSCCLFIPTILQEMDCRLNETLPERCMIMK